jgi:hypothetical protein
MTHDKAKINAKLYELGTAIGLGESEIYRAKRTAKTIVSMGIMAVIFGLIGFLSSRLDAVGLWYVAVSAKDFSFLNNFF